jgi:hypothetical protein
MIYPPVTNRILVTMIPNVSQTIPGCTPLLALFVGPYESIAIKSIKICPNIGDLWMIWMFNDLDGRNIPQNLKVQPPMLQPLSVESPHG